jgi:hypothetical protein
MSKRGTLRYTEEAFAEQQAKRERFRSTPAPVAAHARKKFGNVAAAGKDSKREARRADVLRLLAKSGEITELQEQIKYLLIPKQVGERECTYTLDFQYRDKLGEMVYEDVKGYPNDRWPIKRKLMLFVHGIRVREV